jgi:Tfp pilus assembly protein PilX
MQKTHNESGQALLTAVIVLVILAILGYAALEYGSQTARLTFAETARNVAQHLDSLATQDAMNWGNANISFPPGTPTGTAPDYFYNDACANGSVGCTTPLTAAQVAATSSIWNTAAIVNPSVVAPLASSFPGATVKWVMEYYGHGLCTVSGCSSTQAPTNVCTCYYYRISALTTNNPNNPANGIAAVTQILYRIPQPR